MAILRGAIWTTLIVLFVERKVMIKIFAAFILSFSLVGCYQQTSNVDIERAIKVCGGVQNVEEVKVMFDSRELVKCKNTERYSLDKVAL